MNVTPSVRLIADVAARYFGLRRTDILSARRGAPLVRARQVAMFVARELTPRSLPEIGLHLGGRDHTTVLHGVRKIEREMEQDEVLADDVAAVTAAAIAAAGVVHVSPSDRDPVEIATAILDGGRAVTMVSLDDLRKLASAVRLAAGGPDDGEEPEAAEPPATAPAEPGPRIAFAPIAITAAARALLDALDALDHASFDTRGAISNARQRVARARAELALALPETTPERTA